ncbi:bis(5'-nucleosyl)-tetraphosphatase (symmetrical) YqeK [bacterium]
MEKYNFSYIKHILREITTSYRYKHCIHSASAARALAESHNEDIIDAEAAGLVHDCAKDIDFKDYSEYDIDIKKIPDYDLLLQKAPGVIHSFASAQLAKKVFGITDACILHACERHTLGNKNMTALDKIIYIADLIEPMRVYKEVEKLRSEAYSHLDTAFMFAVRIKISHLLVHKKYICRQTIEMWNSLV